MLTLKQIFIEHIGLKESHYQQLCSFSETITLGKKDFLLKENNICSFVGFVESGVIRSFLRTDDKELNNDFYFPNSFVTAFRSFLTQTPSYSTIQALSDAKIHCISYNKLKELEKTSDAWNKFGKYIAEQLFIRKCKRETSLLKHSAKERYDILIQTYPLIEQFVPQYQIASYLGIEPESLSRLKALTYIKK